MGWTPQKLIDDRMKLTAQCERCNHSHDLDLEALKGKIGPDAPAMRDDLLPKLRCTRCGSKDVGLIYAPDPDKVSGMGRSHYAKSKGQ